MIRTATSFFFQAIEMLGFTPLHSSVRSNNIEKTELLLEYGVDSNAKNEKNFTPLHIAICLKYEEIIELLLRHNADPNTLFGGGFEPTTPLDTAVLSEHVEIVKLLLKYGADPNAYGSSSGTPLHTAAIKNNVEIAELLLSYGADPNIVNEHGKTPLYHANHIEMLKILLEYNMDPIILSKEFLFLTFHYNKDIKIARLLVEHGAIPDADSTNCLVYKQDDQALRDFSQNLPNYILESVNIYKIFSVIFASNSVEKETLKIFLLIARDQYQLPIDLQIITIIKSIESELCIFQAEEHVLKRFICPSCVEEKDENTESFLGLSNEEDNVDTEIEEKITINYCTVPEIILPFELLLEKGISSSASDFSSASCLTYAEESRSDKTVKFRKICHLNKLELELCNVRKLQQKVQEALVKEEGKLVDDGHAEETRVFSIEVLKQWFEDLFKQEQSILSFLYDLKGFPAFILPHAPDILYNNNDDSDGGGGGDNPYASIEDGFGVGDFSFPHNTSKENTTKVIGDIE